jgi:DNA-binding Lrp family transcriptional regulator
MKETELKLISELMKNSRRSDRELAKAIGTSQPTVSRMIQKLEKQGIISEYTMIPDFTKLGYSLLTISRSRARSRRKLTRNRGGRDKWAWGMMR